MFTQIIPNKKLQNLDEIALVGRKDAREVYL